VIPVLLVLGAVLGRWWRTTLVVAAVGWPALLVATDVMDVEPVLLAAAALAVANVGVGLLLHHAVAWAWRSLRRTAGAA
jgi:hypothetical protein